MQRIVTVTTHGSSKWVNVVEGEAGKRTVTRTLQVLCGWRCRTSWIALYGVDTSTPSVASGSSIGSNDALPASDGPMRAQLSATATWAATLALCSASERLAGMLRPSVAAAIRPSTNGVMAAPTMPARSQSVSASVSTAFSSSGSSLVGGRDRHGEEDPTTLSGAMAEHRCHLGC